VFTTVTVEARAKVGVGAPAGAEVHPDTAGDDTSGPGRLSDPSRRATTNKAAVAAADLVTMALSLWMATLAWQLTFGGDAAEAHRYLGLGLVSLPVWSLVFAARRLYVARFFLRFADEARRLAAAVSTGAIGVALLAYLADRELARGWWLLAWGHALVFMLIERTAVRAIFRRLRRSRRLQRPVVVVGLNQEGTELSRMLHDDPALGYEVVGFVDDLPTHVTDGAPLLGRIDDTLDAVRQVDAQGVIIAATALDMGASNKLIRELVDAGIHVQLSSTLRDIASYRLTVQPLGRFPVVYVEPVVRTGWRRHAKRVFDIVVATGGLLVGAPVLAVAAIAIKATSSGPVLFKQTRVGRDGEPFQVLKLRTMVTDAEAQLADLREQNGSDGPLFKMEDDPRITSAGKLLRKLSIDELPQLWNVLRDEMSIVGPRPALPDEVDQWTPELFQRLRVKPGITGMWQVNGRSSASFAEYVRLDLYYVDNWSLVNDLVIVAKTIPAVLTSRGAY
jgi:exopolysaccharide biosynthesis polyprenyl glycosylphosphotransferase